MQVLEAIQEYTPIKRGISLLTSWFTRYNHDPNYSEIKGESDPTSEFNANTTGQTEHHELQVASGTSKSNTCPDASAGGHELDDKSRNNAEGLEGHEVDDKGEASGTEEKNNFEKDERQVESTLVIDPLLDEAETSFCDTSPNLNGIKKSAETETFNDKTEHAGDVDNVLAAPESESTLNIVTGGERNVKRNRSNERRNLLSVVKHDDTRQSSYGALSTSAPSRYDTNSASSLNREAILRSKRSNEIYTEHSAKRKWFPTLRRRRKKSKRTLLGPKLLYKESYRNLDDGKLCTLDHKSRSESDISFVVAQGEYSADSDHSINSCNCEENENYEGFVDIDFYEKRHSVSESSYMTNSSESFELSSDWTEYSFSESNPSLAEECRESDMPDTASEVSHDENPSQRPKRLVRHKRNLLTGQMVNESFVDKECFCCQCSIM